ncbi:MAG: hypothetical protein V7K76_26675 [Nostoc sp.]|uniref:hypothetical protein n=1 Tax=Nostoc sp. TaxID=1180 RepID=UPI002FF47B72
MGEGELELCLPSPKDGRGAGGEGKDLSSHWDAQISPEQASDEAIARIKQIVDL